MLLETRFYGNDIVAWVFAAFVAGTMLAATIVAKWLLLGRLPESRPGHDLRWPAVFRDLVERTTTLFLIIAAISPAHHACFAAVEKVLPRLVVARSSSRALGRPHRHAAVWQFAPRRSGAHAAISVIEVLGRVGIWSLTLR
jgi:hypothetical protein